MEVLLVGVLCTIKELNGCGGMSLKVVWFCSIISYEMEDQGILDINNEILPRSLESPSCASVICLPCSYGFLVLKLKIMYTK